MKKFLPVILFLVGIGVLVGVYFLVIKGRGDEAGSDDESALQEVSLNARPVTSLTPSEDGHWLKLEVEKIVIDAATLDYELLYKLPDGRTQGVPGTIKLEGKGELERDLLLGSESSGKFRYDEGVKEGTLTLRFRNDKGKLIAKFVTGFHLQSDDLNLNLVDGVFSYTLDDTSDSYFVTMETFGVPESPDNVSSGPYGVFSSSSAAHPGEVELNGKISRWDGDEWKALEEASSSDIGIFVGTSE